jgi:tetratricopeptide (TPR) repeat protein
VTEVARDLAQASVLLDLKRYDEAASLLARAVAAQPQDSRAWCLLAAAHLGAGRYEEAAAAASRAITLAPLDDGPYRLASIAQRHLGQITAAISSANQACKLAPDDWRAYACLAQAELATEADFLAQAESREAYFTAAERAADTAVRLAPDEPDAHFTAGLVSYAQRKWKAARAHQERALALDPAHGGALNELGRISLRRGGSPRAARHFIQAARSAPGVSIYGRNAEISVQRVLGLTALTVLLASWALTIAVDTPLSRRSAVLGYALVIALAAGYGAVQLWRMPPETRLLLQTRQVGVALGALYGAVLIQVITAAVTPAGALPLTIYAPFALIVTSPLIARAILRRMDSKTGRDVTHDRAVSARCLECGAMNAEGTEVCARCGSPTALQLPVAASPAAAQPAGPGGSSRGLLIVLGMTAGLVLVSVLIAGLVPLPSSTSPTAATGQLAEDQLQPGDCLRGSNMGLGSGSDWPDLVTAVSCTQAHIAEVFFASDAWPQSLVYPGDNTVSDQGDARCLTAFSAYDGIDNSSSAFTFDDITPSGGDDWDSGDRWLVCVAYESTGQYPGGAPVDYSIKGSGR